MSAVIHPAQVTKAGKAAQHIADTMVKPAHSELADADKDKSSAHLKGSRSGASLDQVISAWEPATTGLQGNVHETGGKLVRTANTYISHDDAAVDLFEYVAPVYDNHHPMPR